MSLQKIKIGIIGAGGFTGLELISLLNKHPHAEISFITSNEYLGKTLPEIRGSLDSEELRALQFSPHPTSSAEIPSLDVVFLAVPDAVAQELAPKVIEKGIQCVDLSGAFRLKAEEDLKSFYNLDNKAPSFLKNAVYGLTECARDSIKAAQLVANPGCYPTACILPFTFLSSQLPELYPVLNFDAKSGTSGAGGRKEKDGLAYSEVYENFRAYKVEGHQHQPEIRDYVRQFTSFKTIESRFIPHLLPMYRGLFATTQAFCIDDPDLNKLKNAALEADKNTFIRYIEDPNKIQLKNVQNTNFLDFSFYYEKNTKTLSILSVIDNLQKGAAGQAIQNMNLMTGFPEEMGLL